MSSQVQSSYHLNLSHPFIYKTSSPSSTTMTSTVIHATSRQSVFRLKPAYLCIYDDFYPIIFPRTHLICLLLLLLLQELRSTAYPTQITLCNNKYPVPVNFITILRYLQKQYPFPSPNFGGTRKHERSSDQRK